MLLDLRMPVMDGHELAATLRRTPDGSALPIEVLSGDPIAESAVAGVNEALRKPIEVHQLVSSIPRALERHAV